MIETIYDGAAKTPFMTPGDTVRIEMLDKDGKSIFGAIEQKVVRYEARSDERKSERREDQGRRERSRAALLAWACGSGPWRSSPDSQRLRGGFAESAILKDSALYGLFSFLFGHLSFLASPIGVGKLAE